MHVLSIFGIFSILMNIREIVSVKLVYVMRITVYRVLLVER